MKRTSKCLNNDIATGNDSLGFKPYVEAIAEFLIDENTSAPITLSIEGQWGCGKSSFMRQLKEKIENGNEPEAKKKKYFTVWFNCWRFEKEDELWAAFALSFIEQLSEQLSWWERQRAKINLVWLRLKFKWKSDGSVAVHIFLRIISIIGVTLFWLGVLRYSPSIMEILFSYSTNDGSVKTITNVLLILTAFVGLIRHLFSFWKDSKMLGNPFDFSKFVRNSNYTEHISFIEHFHSDFDQIIKSYAGNSRVYVFIDDLDRCEILKAAELMQALNLMISEEAKIYFSIGMDRKIISAGLAARNKSILRYLDVNGLEYGYDFIEKFIQLPFKVPSPKNEDFKGFIYSQHENESFLKASDSYPNLLSKFFEKFKASNSGPLHGKESTQQKSTYNVEPDEKIPEEARMEKSDEAEKILNDHDCEDAGEFGNIIEMVAPALDRNPRRIKQFFNLFRFQRTIGSITGLFSYDEGTAPENIWNCKKLAKFVTINMKWPALVFALSSNRTLFDQLQEYALGSKNADKNIDDWFKDEKLLELFRYGCVDGSNVPKNVNEYSLSGLDFSKLLQISPIVAYPGIGEFTKVNMEFVLIPKEEFMMGSDEYSSEHPIHNVTIKDSFYLGKYPVTQKQYEKIMGSCPSRFRGDNLPVDNVTLNDIQEFITKLNKKEGTDKYRLPSEAEWECACRAETTTRYFFGDNDLDLDEYGWYDNNSDGGSHPVGLKKPNPWGLYDMHGNVWEWCQDIWHDNYDGAPSDGKAWEDKDISIGILRGGSWSSFAGSCRSARRLRRYTDDDSDNSDLGFRLVKTL